MTNTLTSDQKAHFQALAESQLSRLYSIARRLCGVDAEDAVQEALLKAFRSFPQLKSDQAGPSWLVSILVNCCKDRARTRARRPAEVSIDDVDAFSLYRRVSDEDPFPYSDSLHTDFLGSFDGDDVRQVLLSLPLMYRAPLVLVHMQGFSTREVSGMLGIPLGTLLARLHRGRKLFERRLWEHAVSNGLLEGDDE